MSENKITFPVKLASNNPQSFGIVDATEISGHRRVNTLSDLYAISDPVLSILKDGSDAIGQEWFVVSENCKYRLDNWGNRRSVAGWTKLPKQEFVNTKQSISEKDQPNGYAGLDSNGKLPIEKTYGATATVVDVATYESLPVTGSSSVIYYVSNTGAQYKWSGSAYIDITDGVDNAKKNETSIFDCSNGTSTKYYTSLSAAINVVPAAYRTSNRIISYLSTENSTTSAVNYQYHGIDSTTWNDLTKWERIPNQADLADIRSDLNETIEAGYKYMGVARPTTLPITNKGKVFYIAVEPGIYTNFDNLAVDSYTILYKDTNWSRNSLSISFNDARQEFIARYSSTTNLLDWHNQINGIVFDRDLQKFKYQSGSRISHLIPCKGLSKMTFSGFSQYGNVAVFLSDYKLSSIVDWFNLNNGSTFVGTRTIDVPQTAEYVVVTMGYSDNLRKVSNTEQITTAEFELEKIEYIGSLGYGFEYLSETNNILVPGSRTDIRITDDYPYFVSPSAYSVTSSIFIVKGLKRIIVSRNTAMTFQYGSPYLAFLTQPKLLATNVISIVNTERTQEIVVPDNAKYAIMMLNTSMDRETAPWNETKVSMGTTATTDEYIQGDLCKIFGQWITEYKQEIIEGDEEIFKIEKTETDKRAIPYSIGTPGGDVASFDNSYQRFNMLLFTDNHIDTDVNASLANVADVVKYLNTSKMPIDSVINCGDFITPFGQSKQTAITRATKYFDAINKSSIPIMQAIGNHDANDWTNPPQNALIDSDWSDLYYSYMSEKVSSVHDTGISTYKTPYYYKDFENKKVRVICLNAEDIPHEVGLVDGRGYCLYYGGNAWYIRQQQFDWFVNSALDFSGKEHKDWGVVVFMHQDYRYGVSQLGGSQIISPNDGALKKVFLTLKALNTQTNYSNEFVCQNDNRFNLNIDANFSEYTGVSEKPYVIGVFVGHEHVDKNEVYEGINLIYTANGSATMTSSDARVARVIGTPTQNLFDVFSIDTRHRKIYATRFGAGLNCYGVGGDRFKPNGLSF